MQSPFYYAYILDKRYFAYILSQCIHRTIQTMRRKYLMR